VFFTFEVQFVRPIGRDSLGFGIVFIQLERSSVGTFSGMKQIIPYNEGLTTLTAPSLSSLARADASA